MVSFKVKQGEKNALKQGIMPYMLVQVPSNQQSFKSMYSSAFSHVNIYH